MCLVEKPMLLRMRSVLKVAHGSALRITILVALGWGLLPMYLHAAAGGPHSSFHDKSRGYLGIEFHDTSEDQIAALHLQATHGAEILLVDHDGPAGKAGLQPRDVILQMDGQNIENAEDLSRCIRESAPGKVVNLFIVRVGRSFTLTAKLADQKDLERNAWMQHLMAPQAAPPEDSVENILVQRYSVETAPAPRTQSRGQSFIGTVLRTGPYTGASLEAMEPQLAGFFGAPPKTGLLVHAVEANSPAALAGLHAGDVILRVDAVPVASTSEWSKRLRASGGHAVSLTILREKREQTLTLQTAKSHSLLEWPKLF